jgi:hypothetical protein
MEDMDRPLDRKQASQELRDKHGIKHSPEYLAKLACVGGGPGYYIARRTPIYTPKLLAEYAKEITSPVVRSTSELRTERAAAKTAGKAA